MDKYFRYCAIFETKLLTSLPHKIVADPVKIEFFVGPRSLEVPLQTELVAIQGQDTDIAKGVILNLSHGPYISITVRTVESNPLAAYDFCESHLNATITNLSLISDYALFRQQIYRGWLIGDRFIVSAWIQMKPKVPFPHNASTRLDSIRASQMLDNETLIRVRLMAKFWVKALLSAPGEERFLFLWTILEIYPMKNTSDIAPISLYLETIMHKDKRAIKDKLQIGQLFGARCRLVHDGQLGIPLTEINEVLTRLETVCLEIIRTFSGEPYSGSLDKYMEKIDSH